MTFLVSIDENFWDRKFSISKFFHFSYNFQWKFSDMKKSKNANFEFFRKFLRSKKIENFSLKIVWKWKNLRSKKIDFIRSQNFWSTDFHFDLTFFLINRYGRDFVYKYADFHDGGDGVGYSPPNQALRCGIRMFMSSNPPACYIVTF